MGSGNVTKYKHFKHIIGHCTDALENGVAEEEVSTWVEDLSRANRSVAFVDLDLTAMETEQVEKRSKIYMATSLGHLSTKKPAGYTRFMMTQLNGIAGAMTRRTNIEQSII